MEDSWDDVPVESVWDIDDGFLEDQYDSQWDAEPDYDDFGYFEGDDDPLDYWIDEDDGWPYPDEDEPEVDLYEYDIEEAE